MRSVHEAWSDLALAIERHQSAAHKWEARKHYNCHAYAARGVDCYESFERTTFSYSCGSYAQGCADGKRLVWLQELYVSADNFTDV